MSRSSIKCINSVSGFQNRRARASPKEEMIIICEHHKESPRPQVKIQVSDKNNKKSGRWGKDWLLHATHLITMSWPLVLVVRQQQYFPFWCLLCLNFSGLAWAAVIPNILTCQGCSFVTVVQSNLAQFWWFRKVRWNRAFCLPNYPLGSQ